MLSTNFKTSDVVSVKLTSGEELVGYFVDITNSILRLRKPLSLTVTQQGNPSLAPYFITSDVMNIAAEVEFNKSNVVAIVKTKKDFADSYTQATSGLDMSAHK